jgi:hypothetical protein
MKKGFVVGLAMMFCFVFVTAVFAQGGEEAKLEFNKKLGLAKSVAFEGTVTAHDVLCHCAVIKTKAGKVVTMNDDYAKFMQEYNNAKGLKIGSAVKGEYKVVDGINYMISISYAG